jgi:hypothetical protein
MLQTVGLGSVSRSRTDMSRPIALLRKTCIVAIALAGGAALRAADVATIVSVYRHERVDPAAYFPAD